MEIDGVYFTADEIENFINKTVALLEQRYPSPDVVEMFPPDVLLAVKFRSFDYFKECFLKYLPATGEFFSNPDLAMRALFRYIQKHMPGGA